jgi:hypothetical protein
MHKLSRVQLESDGISYNRLLVSLGSASAGGGSRPVSAWRVQAIREFQSYKNLHELRTEE